MSIRERYRTFQGWRKMRRRVKETEEITGLRGKVATRAATAELVDQALKDMVAAGIGFDTMFNVVRYKLGIVKSLRPDELRIANTLVGELACVKGLIQQGWLDLAMLERYAWTGYQSEGVQFDPILASVRQSYAGGEIKEEHVDIAGLEKHVREASAKDFRAITPDGWERANRFGGFAQAHPKASEMWFEVLAKNADSKRMRLLESMLDTGSRHAVSNSRREALTEIIKLLRERVFAHS